MPMLNVKIVSAPPGRWRIVALFSAGVALNFAIDGLGHIPSLPAKLALTLILISGVLVPLSLSEQRFWQSCYEGFAAGMGLAVGYAFMLWSSAGADPDPKILLTIRILGLVFLLLCVVIRLIGLWFVRSLIRRLVVQTGSLCWTCAHDLTGNQSGVCPECGVKVEQKE